MGVNFRQTDRKTHTQGTQIITETVSDKTIKIIIQGHYK